MELAILVYVVEKLSNNGGWIFFLSLALVVTVVATLHMKLDLRYSWEETRNTLGGVFSRMWVKVLLIIWITWGIFMPSRETAIYMAGAYMLQQTVTHDKTRELGGVAYSVTLNQLKLWAKENSELEALLDTQLAYAVPKEEKPNKKIDK